MTLQESQWSGPLLSGRFEWKEAVARPAPVPSTKRPEQALTEGVPAPTVPPQQSRTTTPTNVNAIVASRLSDRLVPVH